MRAGDQKPGCNLEWPKDIGRKTRKCTVFEVDFVYIPTVLLP